jgi:aminoglycoside phosphotransferase (APT) family kinase protein
MSVPFPRDDALGPGAAAVVDGEAVAARLSPIAGSEVTCRPRYARYKPGTSLLVQYDATIGPTAVLVHAWLFTDARAARTSQGASFRRLVERTRRRHPNVPLQATFLPELNALVEVSPLDSRLPALARAASAKVVARLLGGAAPAALPKASVETVRHKPGRKAVLRFITPHERLYLKVYADGASSRRFALARAVAGRGIPTATALADIPQIGAVSYPEAPGERLADLIGTDEYRRWLGPAADALRAFHARAPIDARPRSQHSRVEVAGLAVDSLLPNLGGAGTRLAAEIAKRIETYNGALVLAHGDYYDDQLLVAPEQVVILDLDESRPAHPLVDVANFLAHMSVRGAESDRAAFLAACADAGFDLTGVLAFEAAALLALAVRPFRHLTPAWPERVEETMDLAAARLRADRLHRGPADSKLPQLHTLVDPVAARPVLERALGRPVGIGAVDVLRHKRGRRCTLRYQLLDGACVYAKTYAGRRAARVHDSYHRLTAAREIRIPVPLGWDKDLRLVATAPLRGRKLHDRLLAGDRRLGVEIAELLHSLHSSGVLLERRHSLDDEVAPLTDRVERLAATAPALSAAARRCLRFAREGCGRDWTWRLRPIHRDFYEDQLVTDGAGLAVLDLDDAAMSEPAVDVANLIAHLRLRALRSDNDAAGLNVVTRTFRRRYQALDPDLDAQLVSFLVGATLLRLADIHLPRAGEPLAADLLARAERALRLAIR